MWQAVATGLVAVSDAVVGTGIVCFCSQDKKMWRAAGTGEGEVQVEVWLK